MTNHKSIETSLIHDLSIDEIDQVSGALSLGGIIDFLEFGIDLFYNHQYFRGLEIIKGLIESAPPVPFKDPGTIA